MLHACVEEKCKHTTLGMRKALLLIGRVSATMDHARSSKFAWGIDLTVFTVLLVGLLSSLLFLYSDWLWKTSFRRNVPVLVNIMQARVSLAEGYLWLDQLLKGNETIQIDVILGSYDQAAQSVDACLKGQSAIRGLPGLPMRDENLISQLERFRESIEKTRGIAEARWQNREVASATRDIDLNLHTAYHGMGLMASVINSKLQEDVSAVMRSQRTVHLLTLTLWLTLLAGVGTVLTLASRKRKQSDERLRVYQERLRSLASELVLTEERERRRLATDLHDSIAQNLAISKIKLHALRGQLVSDDLTSALDEIRELLEPAIRDARSLIFQLSPPILYEMGLEAALESLADQVQQQHGLVTIFTDDQQPKPLKEDILVLLFRAVQELLINVIKHSEASTARITMRRDDFSIKERLDYLGGRLEINSRPNQGTQVSLLAPLQHDEEIKKEST